MTFDDRLRVYRDALTERVTRIAPGSSVRVSADRVLSAVLMLPSASVRDAAGAKSWVVRIDPLRDPKVTYWRDPFPKSRPLDETELDDLPFDLNTVVDSASEIVAAWADCDDPLTRRRDLLDVERQIEALSTVVASATYFPGGLDNPGDPSIDLDIRLRQPFDRSILTIRKSAALDRFAPDRHVFTTVGKSGRVIGDGPIPDELAGLVSAASRIVDAAFMRRRFVSDEAMCRCRAAA